MRDVGFEKWFKNFEKALSNCIVKIGNRVVSLGEGVEFTIGLFRRIQESNKTVWWVGNGGSSAICSHISLDLINKGKMHSAVLTDYCLITCMSNDYGYESVFSKPLEVVASRGDLLVAISSSGRSKNILKCTKVAIKKNMKLITLSGFENNNPLWNQRADVSFYIPSRTYGHVEMGHQVLLHALVDSMYLNG